MGPSDLLVPDADLIALIRARLARQGNADVSRANQSARNACAVGDAEAADDDDERVRQAALDAFFGRDPAA